MSRVPTLITVARAESGLLAHFPDVVLLARRRSFLGFQARDAKLLATYREGPGHVASDGRIVVVDSTDGGLTWGEPRVAVDGPFDDRDPKLVRLSDGTVLLSYFVIDWSTKPRHTTLGTFVRRSTDNGRTWGPEVRVTTEMSGDGRTAWSASHGAPVELPGGDLLIPIYGRTPGAKWSQATVVRSTDGGRTWTGEALLAKSGEFHFQEPTLTVLNGQVVALIRTTGERAWLTRSSDNGHTWSTAAPTDMPASSHHALALKDGRVLVTYGDLSKRFSERRDTVGRIVGKPLETWDGYCDVHLYDSGHPDQANPSSVEVSPGRFLTLGFDVPKATVVGVFTEASDYQ